VNLAGRGHTHAVVPLWWAAGVTMVGLSMDRFWCSPAPAQAFEFVSGSVLGTAMYDTLGSLAVLPGANTAKRGTL
jgi:hypothetical protein